MSEPDSIMDMPLERGDPGRTILPCSSTAGGNNKLGVDEFEGGLAPRLRLGLTGDGGSEVGGNFPSLTIHAN